MQNGQPQTTPIQQQARKQTAEDVARARDIEAMMNTAGWKAYQKLINERIETLASGFFNPIQDSEALRQEHTKGLVYGLIMCRDWPSAIVKDAKEARTKSAAADEGDE